MKKKYDQNKLASILAQIAKETRELITKYAFGLVCITTPILMQGQDTVRCIVGVDWSGVTIAHYSGSNYAVKYSPEGQSYIVVGKKKVFIKTRKRNVKIAK